MNSNRIESIQSGRCSLGIELGSTRIKAVLIDEHHAPVAMGSHDWENRFEDGVWTYTLEDVWTGIQSCYRSLADNVKKQYDVTLTQIASLGFSAMMHGYMVFDQEDQLLVPFRTWRNTMTEEASTILTKELGFHIPQRWSAAHLYQAILNKESHVREIAFQTTLAGYVHWKCSGEKVLGIGEASGMYPIDSNTKQFHKGMLTIFQNLIAKDVDWNIQAILPKVLLAGESAGVLTQEGALLLDPSGKLCKGAPMCPPEGDAGTGMVATNSVARKTGNVSAGTSVFAMLVLENDLQGVYDEIDLVTTPVGDLVAMVHCNNCTSDINAWVGLFKEFADTIGAQIDMRTLYDTLYFKGMEGDADCGGLMAYNYFSGEHITGFEKGRPLFVRTPESRFTLANFMRTHTYTSLGALKIGLDILMKKEGVQVDEIVGHGGFFKTREVGQRVMAAAINAPVTVMDNAGEGGAWGIAILAAYLLRQDQGQTLDRYLQDDIFGGQKGIKVDPIAEDVEGFEIFVKRYQNVLPVERAAADITEW